MEEMFAEAVWTPGRHFPSSTSTTAENWTQIDVATCPLFARRRHYLRDHGPGAGIDPAKQDHHQSRLAHAQALLDHIGHDIDTMADHRREDPADMLDSVIDLLERTSRRFSPAGPEPTAPGTDLLSPADKPENRPVLFFGRKPRSHGRVLSALLAGKRLTEHIETAAALPHVTGSPGLGVLQRLRPVSTRSSDDGLSLTDTLAV